MNGLFQQVFCTVTDDDLALVNVIKLREKHREDALFALIVDACIESQLLNIKLSDGFFDLGRGLKVELIAIEII